ncbi:hypothetical protein CB1_000749006 [Camelus ferus]|nr:hypothetical protein CB1_000749006 [Camelus ferus]
MAYCTNKRKNQWHVDMQLPVKIEVIIKHVRTRIWKKLIQRHLQRKSSILFGFGTGSGQANCVPPCQNGGMCLRPQLCVCKPGTEGRACETMTAQDTVSPVSGGQSPAFSWAPPEPAAKHTSSKKADALPRVSPVAQMTLTLKPKPSVGLSQQIHSQFSILCLRIKSLKNTCYVCLASAGKIYRKR